MLLAPPNKESSPVLVERNIENGKDNDIPKEDEALLPLVVWVDLSSHDRSWPVELKQSAPEDPSVYSSSMEPGGQIDVTRQNIDFTPLSEKEAGACCKQLQFQYLNRRRDHLLQYKICLHIQCQDHMHSHVYFCQYSQSYTLKVL
ncbi:hypothetical protein Dsin_005325 [Dipteronia sinensis]|uniref:Uncharacterized protein n=1 Tax=Dipteronia sinensis TaxID=43782 RepID=A0AAE0AWE9_9ROSI|nr:hypothetical protein Dsin_005325 [Dipteronia sinensis]